MLVYATCGPRSSFLATGSGQKDRRMQEKPYASNHFKSSATYQILAGLRTVGFRALRSFETAEFHRRMVVYGSSK